MHPIRKIRKANDVSQLEIFRVTGLAPSALSLIESGAKPLRPLTEKKIRDAIELISEWKRAQDAIRLPAPWEEKDDGEL